MQKKTYTQEFKREACDSLRPVGSRLPRLPVSWVFPTRGFITGAKSWLSMVPKPFQEVDTKQRWKKKIVGSNGNWSERDKNAIY
jgi:hypothetical protein